MFPTQLKLNSDLIEFVGFQKYVFTKYNSYLIKNKTKLLHNKKSKSRTNTANTWVTPREDRMVGTV